MVYLLRARGPTGLYNKFFPIQGYNMMNIPYQSAFLLCNLEGAIGPILAWAAATAITVIGAQSSYCPPMAAAAGPSANVEPAP